MKNEISIYNFNQNPIRTTSIDGQPYFCLVDACGALGLSNSRQTKTQLSEAGVTKTYVSYESGAKELTFINEPNLYRLIFRSNKPQAQAFADWVYSEVLPSIRKTGGYGVPSLTQDRNALKAIGGMVKRCVNKALTDFLSAELPASDDVLRQKYYNITDKDMAETLQRWYWSRNYDVRQTLDQSAQRIEELEYKLRMVKQAVN